MVLLNIVFVLYVPAYVYLPAYVCWVKPNKHCIQKYMFKDIFKLQVSNISCILKKHDFSRSDY